MRTILTGDSLYPHTGQFYMSKEAEDIFYLRPEVEVSKTSAKQIDPLEYSYSNREEDLELEEVNMEIPSTPEESIELLERLENPSVSTESDNDSGQNDFNLSGDSQLSFVNSNAKSLKLLGVESHLTSLAQLIANVTESHSAVIFIADSEKSCLRVGGAQTLSTDFHHTASIDFGTSLIGWVAESKTPLSVCPFEHDATTLLYYNKSQTLKSFTALPILNDREEILGVIACDSTKTYAYSKVTEKILLDFAKQASTLISLNQAVAQRPTEVKVDRGSLDKQLDLLRFCKSEKELLVQAASIPADLISRDALAVLTTAENGVGSGKYYCVGSEALEHRLLDIVCKHKKILCSERSVHAMPTDDLKQRSFLSIPFNVLEKEAGSINLLSKPHQAFDASEISAVEVIAGVVANRLEHLRLVERVEASSNLTNLLSWKPFCLLSKNRIQEGLEKKQSLSLIKIAFDSYGQIENYCGIEGTQKLKARTERLVEQTMRSSSLACRLYDNKILVLTENSEVESFIHRFCAQIQKFSLKDLGLGEDTIPSPSLIETGLGDTLLSGARFVVTNTPQDGETIVELTKKCLQLEQQEINK